MPRTMIRAFIATVCLALLLASAACSVNQLITIKADNSGTATLRVETAKSFREYLLNLAEVAGPTELSKQGKIFDAVALQKDLATRPGITVKRVVSPTPDSLEMELAFASVQDVYGGSKDVASTGVVTLSESGGKKTLKLHIDRKNFAQLSAAFPAMSDAVFQGLAPQEQDNTTEAEYLEMIRFSLGDHGPELVKQSFITLTVKPEGEILSQTGGTATNGGVTFRIPLIRLLVLDKPLDYGLTWK